MDNQSKLEDAMFTAIEAGRQIEIQWDCGGDDVMMTVLVDNKEMDYNAPFVRELSLYLMNYLNLPDSGNFQMLGKGNLIIEDDDIFIIYDSVMKGVEDHKTGGWLEMNDKMPGFSGKKKLFGTT